MKRLIFTLIGIVLGLTGLKAVTFTPIEINDPSESVTIKLQPGANYLQLKAIESNTIHFNVGYFGIMMFECNAMGEEGNNLSISYDTEGHKIFSSEVEEGKTYYFSTSMITEPSIDVTIYYGNGEGMPITLTSNFSDGDTYTVSGSNLELAFDRTVNIAHNWIEYGEETEGVFKAKEEIPAGYINGTYYPETGKEGLLTFTFTDELNTDKSKVTIDLSYGDSEAGSMGSFNPDFTIEGKTVVVDIRGYRFPETVETSRDGEVQTVITMNIKGLTTADGRPIITNNASAGTSGIVVTYPLKKQEISFFYDFLPTEGSSLADCSEIIIWLPEEVGVLTFDKVLLQWLNNRGTLQTKEFKAEDVPFAYDESYAGYVSHIPLAGVSKDREVTLTVEGGMLSNGDSVEITGKFNTDPTGIDSVLGDDANAVVKLYTIDGILVKEAPAATVLTGVKKGVYIMNGKKVVVK
ncbi:MAG: hypothetical protein U0M48_03825 [Xylanibacter rarus]